MLRIGNEHLTMVPVPFGSRVTSSDPPITLARYPMMCRPIPDVRVGMLGIPTPLSSMASRPESPRAESATTILVARPCLMALFTASCAMWNK